MRLLWGRYWGIDVIFVGLRAGWGSGRDEVEDLVDGILSLNVDVMSEVVD